jgi:protein phosphatase
MSANCKLQVAGLTHQGLVREQNEDRYIIDQGVGCFLIADGMGGHLAGEVASRIAAETIAKKLARWSGKPSRDPAKTLQDAIHAAHQAVRKEAAKSLARRGMGSTVVVAWLQPDSCQLWLGHVGDSRAYLLRGSEFFLLTEDHTIYNQARRAGMLGPDPQMHPPRGVLSQAIGPSDAIAPEVVRIELRPGDRLMLCSDGLTDMLSDEEIKALLIPPAELEKTCNTLIQAALKRGGRDNVTVVVLGVMDQER